MQQSNRIKTGLFLSAIALFAACTKDSSNTDQLASLGKTTITGKAFANLVDTTGADGIQYAPSGTMIQAWIDTHDLATFASDSLPYAKRYFTATVDGAGNYTLTIDASKYKPVTVHIDAPSFTHDVLTQVGPDSTANVRHIFHMSTAPVMSVNNGATNTVDLNFL